MKGLRLLWELADSIRETDGLCGRECIAERIEGIAMVIESEDKLAADWVKSAGGLERVSAAWDWVSRHGGLEAVIDRWASSIPVGNARSTMHRAEERRRRLAAHAHHLEGLLSERRREIGRLRREAAEMRRRLIPEDMEWPRFEDGEPVRFGCEFEFEGAVDVVESVTFHCAGSPAFNYGLQDSGERVHGLYVRGERIKRPVPKVLDADGVEIRAGDVLYSVETGESVTVEQVEPGNPWFAATSGTLQHCSKFAHKRPDSWERLEEDIANIPYSDYCDLYRIDHSDTSYERAKARDIVRRAKKLAEVE